jgi:ligand-binding SRPBCC domain-containing protein
VGGDVVTEIQIFRPREEVSAYAADPSNATAWYKNIKTVQWETSPPAAVGSRIRLQAQFLGRTLDYTYEIQELAPGRRFVMAQGPFPMETTYTWEDIAEGTSMRLRNRGESSGFAAVTAPVMAAAMRRANQADLRRLKTVLEDSPSSAED